MPESAPNAEQAPAAARLTTKRVLELDGERWNVAEVRVPSSARDSVYLIRFIGECGRELTVTLPVSSTTLSDAELTDVWLRCLLWEQDA